MSRFYYDFHIHSCLSPCGDDESTPNSIAGMASLCGLDVVALTDHNTAKNCPAFFEAAERYGVIPIAGMELTTAEDIHMVCLFETLEGALEFDGRVAKERILIKNRTDIFGQQLIVDSCDNILGTDEHLLVTASLITIDNAPAIAEQYGGICYPAHIDRQSNGIITALGTFPTVPHFSAFELNDADNAAEFVEKYALGGKFAVFGSDAHNLGDIPDASSYLELQCDKADAKGVRREILSMLKGMD